MLTNMGYSSEEDYRIKKELAKGKNETWAALQQPLVNGKPNPDFAKVYGDKALDDDI